VAQAAVPGAAAAVPPVIRFRDVRLSFGEELIYAGLDFDVRQGEFLCLLGPSGCGKSTALRLMSGLLDPDGGEIRVGEGTPHDRRDDFAFVFQSPRLVPWRSALGNVMLGAELRFGRGDRRAREAKARELLALVGLGGDAEKPPAVMSGGERQRVAIARALLVEPRIILMDEPFSALDPRTRTRMRREIVALWQKSGKTVVFVTHDIDEALVLADRVAVFSPKPTRLVEIVQIDAPRWRDPAGDPALAGLRARLHGLMHQEPGENPATPGRNDDDTDMD
jgi:NitT/TauT family transport system ATP-binding protein